MEPALICPLSFAASCFPTSVTPYKLRIVADTYPVVVLPPRLEHQKSGPILCEMNVDNHRHYVLDSIWSFFFIVQIDGVIKVQVIIMHRKDCVKIVSSPSQLRLDDEAGDAEETLR